MGLGIVGPGRNDLPEALDRFVRTLDLHQSVAQIVARLHVVGPQAHRLAIACYGLTEAAQVLEDDPEVVVGFGKHRMQLDGPPMGLRGGFELAQLLARPSQQIPSLGPVGAVRQGILAGPLGPREITIKQEPHPRGKCRLDLRHDHAPELCSNVARDPNRCIVRATGLLSSILAW